MRLVKPKKFLGQHFLKDLKVAQDIADTVDACPGLPILEVGPGMGVLTQFLVKKERPDGSDNHSFPSMHTSVSFTGAAFIQRRYGWKWGIPAYAVATYVGWSRTYAKKHDWWDVAAGAAMGIGSAYIFTRPFAQKHNLTLSPLAGDKHFGIYASMTF